MTDREPTLCTRSRRAVLRTIGVGAGVGSIFSTLPIRGVRAGVQEQKQGEWCEGPPMPDKRTEVAAATLSGELYVVGGFVPNGVTPGVAVFDPATGDESVTGGGQATDDGQATYDGPATGDGVTTGGAWRTVDPLPESRHHAAAVSLNDSLYVVGGFRGRRFDPVDSVWCYDGNEWRARAPLPTPRGALVAEAIDGKIYAVGGQRDGSVATVTVYDPESNEWQERSPMPTARNHLASGTVGGRLYAVGGRKSFSNLLDVTEAYDPGADEWTELPPMPTPRGGLSGSALGGQVVAAGGEGPNGTFEAVEAYDPERAEWAQLPPLPTARHGLGVSTLGGNLYTAAGGPEPGFSFSDALEILRPANPETTTTEGG